LFRKASKILIWTKRRQSIIALGKILWKVLIFKNSKYDLVTSMRVKEDKWDIKLKR